MESKLPWAFVISCEHASPALPPELFSAFEARHELCLAQNMAEPCHSKTWGKTQAKPESLATVLASHYAWDAGALPVAEYWAKRWQAPLFSGQVSRLVCDLNRTLDNKHLWSAYTKHFTQAQKKALLNTWYQPHWQAVQGSIAALAMRSRVLHVAVHSFTPILNGQERQVDIGLLYHPRRPLELALAKNMQRAFAQSRPATKPDGSKVRLYRNAPYYGHTNSLVQFLRTQYAPTQYMGLEIEFNQALLAHGPFPAQMLAELLEQAVHRCDQAAV